MSHYPKIVYSKCIGNFFNYKAMDLIRYAGKWRENIFPYDGNYYNLPSKFVESMELVQNLLMEQQSEKEKKMESFKRK